MVMKMSFLLTPLASMPRRVPSGLQKWPVLPSCGDSALPSRLLTQWFETQRRPGTQPPSSLWHQAPSSPGARPPQVALLPLVIHCGWPLVSLPPLLQGSSSSQSRATKLQ